MVIYAECENKTNKKMFLKTGSLGVVRLEPFVCVQLLIISRGLEIYNFELKILQIKNGGFKIYQNYLNFRIFCAPLGNTLYIFFITYAFYKITYLRLDLTGADMILV